MHFGLPRADLGAPTLDLCVFLKTVPLPVPSSKLLEVQFSSRVGKYVKLIAIKFHAIIIFCDPLIFTAF